METGSSSAEPHSTSGPEKVSGETVSNLPPDDSPAGALGTTEAVETTEDTSAESFSDVVAVVESLENAEVSATAVDEIVDKLNETSVSPAELVEVVEQLQEADAPPAEIVEVLEKAQSGVDPLEPETSAESPAEEVSTADDVPGAFPDDASVAGLGTQGTAPDPAPDNASGDDDAGDGSVEVIAARTIDAVKPSAATPTETPPEFPTEDPVGDPDHALSGPTDLCCDASASTSADAAADHPPQEEKPPTPLAEGKAKEVRSELGAPGVEAEASYTPEGSFPDASSEKVPAENAAVDFPAESLTSEAIAEADAPPPEDAVIEEAVQAPTEAAAEETVAQEVAPPPDATVEEALSLPEEAAAENAATPTEVVAVADGTASATAPSSPDSSKGKSRHRHRAADGWTRARRSSKSSSDNNGHKVKLERSKEAKGLFTNRVAIAVQKAKEKDKARHDSEEYQAERQKRRERREARRAAQREERRAARAAERENEKAAGDALAASEAAREAEKAATATAVANSSSPKSTPDRRRTRRPSTPASSISSAGGAARPGLLRRMTVGESDCGGTLLKLAVNKPVERSSRPSPSGRSSAHTLRHDGVGGAHDDRGAESKGRHRDRERPTVTRPGSSKSASGRGYHYYRDEVVPGIKIRDAFASGLRRIFAP